MSLTPSGQWKFAAKIALFAGLGLLIFWPAVHGEWLWDDTLYLTGNPLLRQPGRLWKAWLVPGSFIEYYPLHQTLQWLQWRFWHEDTLPYHLTNVGLHVVSALLIWRLLARLGLRAAWLGGLLFLVHPMNVESVASISEFKNTLSLPPFLLALACWIDFENTGRPRDYLAAFALFCVAMLCKITMAPFPAVILLYAWWKRGRLQWADLRHALPFFAVALGLGLLTIRAGVDFAATDSSRLPAPDLGGIGPRLALAGETMAFYFARFFWPLHPEPMYFQWNAAPTPAALLPWLAAAGSASYLVSRAREWGRCALLGLGFFFLMLLPFSGIAPISFMNFTWVMDHFLYLPMLGLLGLVVAGWEKLHARLPAGLRRVDAGVIGVLLFCLAVQSQDAAAMWTDRETLWRSTLALNSRAWLAHYNLGNVLREEDRIPEAIAEYRAALDLRPNFAWGHDNLGLALAAEGGKDDEAVAEYRTALRLEPGLAEAHNNLANALAPSPGGLPEAIAEYRAALRLRPGLVAAHYNLGVALSKTPGQSAAARAEFQEALRLDPSLEAARERLAEPGR